MKIIKRDGRIVEYNREKIFIAITKANRDVLENERASKKQIETIIKHIEELNRKRMLVEDIQDFIETELMKIKKYSLAKKYIIYRYTRALVRKSNSTDESILSLIKNSNKINPDSTDKRIISVDKQRELITGEVSKDIAKRIMLPEKISEAINKGMLYFNDIEYFIHPVINSCIINYQDMLENKTIINNIKINKPKSIQEACNILLKILQNITLNQAGTISIDISHLGKYLKETESLFYEKFKNQYKNDINNDFIKKITNDKVQNELSESINNLMVGINTCCNQRITLFLHLGEKDKYKSFTKKIIQEILIQRIKMIQENSDITESKIIYVLSSENTDLNHLAIQCINNKNSLYFISSKIMKEKFDDYIFSPIDNLFLPLYKNNQKYISEGRFNQGNVTINLPQIAFLADKDEKKFFELLDNRLELCYDALLIRHHTLKGTIASTSPLIWQNGAISRISPYEKIDNFLKNGYSTLVLSYAGLYDTVKYMKNATLYDTIGNKFSIKILKYLKKKCDEWKKETKLAFVLCSMDEENVSKKLALIDKENIINYKKDNSINIYTNYNIENKLSIYEKLEIEKKYQNILLGGTISYVDITNLSKVEKEDLIKYIYHNILYANLFIKERKENERTRN